MTKVALIACVSKKASNKSKAKDLYQSPLFKFNLAYAEKWQAEKVFILSAKYGLIGLEEEIEPYNQTLNTMKSIERKQWAEHVLNQLQLKTDLQKDEFLILAGENYREHLLPQIKKYNLPLRGLGIGKQLHRLKELLHDS